MRSTAADHSRYRLVRHDKQVLVNITRATFSTWRDWLIALVMLLLALGLARSWLSTLPRTTALGFGAAIAIVAGWSAGRQIAARLAFHGFDGLLAADALRPSSRWRYILLWHGFAFALLAVFMLIARPVLLVASPCYVFGAALGHATSALQFTGTAAGKVRLSRSLGLWLHSRSAGATAAMILLLALLPLSRSVETNVLMAAAAALTLLLVLALTIVDDGLVRFMTVSGHGTGRIVSRHARSTLLFAGLAVPCCWLAYGRAMAGIVAAITVVLLLLMALRVCAYRLYGRRFAHFVVAIIAGLFMMTAYIAPFALPLVGAAAFWHLARRAAAKTWLMP